MRINVIYGKRQDCGFTTEFYLHLWEEISGGSRGAMGAMPPLSLEGALPAPEGTLRAPEGMLCTLQQVLWCP